MLKEIGIFEEYGSLINALRGRGALLITGVEKPNPMTIGWATLGVIWGKPVMTVLVRPSRHSFFLINSHEEFVVAVPPADMAKQLAFCGTRSGRDHDKFVECSFTKESGVKVKVPHIIECPIHYECRIIHKNNVEANRLDPAIPMQYYPNGDFHTIYYGEVLGVFKR
ncbi:MAG TPA: flavin reductase family protein [Candidatus Wallbacteria bacterium]|nr:flavin reductase family protein [Candidatus Wallbacteria bacterium]